MGDNLHILLSLDCVFIYSQHSHAVSCEIARRQLLLLILLQKFVLAPAGESPIAKPFDIC